MTQPLMVQCTAIPPPREYGVMDDGVRDERAKGER
jgi:hypothetical protein